MPSGTIKCPYCGSSRAVPTGQSIVSITKGLNGTIERKGLFGRDRASESLQNSNSIIDITCPKCGNTYQYDVRGGQVSQ